MVRPSTQGVLESSIGNLIVGVFVAAGRDVDRDSSLAMIVHYEKGREQSWLRPPGEAKNIRGAFVGEGDFRG